MAQRLAISLGYANEGVDGAHVHARITEARDEKRLVPRSRLGLDGAETV
ncbi:MAG TPA: hypothetical protein VFL66_02585 [Gaiellaceae bacterium]|nr:hypothetical protein [Gaiellaceae bacterium]